MEVLGTAPSYSMVKIVGLDDAFSEIFELEAISRVGGCESLQQKDKIRKKIKGERKDVSPFLSLSKKKMISVHPQGGVANGKTLDSPRRRDPCLKIQDRDLKVLTKSEPETLNEVNRARDFILRKSEHFLFLWQQ